MAVGDPPPRRPPTALVEQILELSEAPDWETAKTEWGLDTIYDEPDKTCLCGHTPIREICVIANQRNHNSAEVGNCCVNNFLGLRSETLFAGVRRIFRDAKASMSEALVDYCYRRKIINEWEHTFYHDIRLKRNLTPAQRRKKVQINEHVLSKIRRSNRFKLTGDIPPANPN